MFASPAYAANETNEIEQPVHNMSVIDENRIYEVYDEQTIAQLIQDPRINFYTVEEYAAYMQNPSGKPFALSSDLTVISKIQKGSLTFKVYPHLSEVAFLLTTCNVNLTTYLDNSYSGNGTKRVYYWQLSKPVYNASHVLLGYITFDIYDSGYEIYNSSGALTSYNTYAPYYWGTSTLGWNLYLSNPEFWGAEGSLSSAEYVGFDVYYV